MREEAEAVDGVDDEEDDPQVERDARQHGEDDPRLAVGFPGGGGRRGFLSNFSS